MSPLAAIHVARKQLGLDEEAYRGLLERITGKRSAAALDEAERGRVVDELRRLGFEPASTARRSGLDGPYAGKLQALWIAAWNLGIVRNRDDAALTAFVERQTGIATVRWLRDAADARRAIEALKSWLARDAGVDWSPAPAADPPHRNDPRYRIAVAIWRRLIASGAVRPFAPHGDADDLTSLERYGYRVTGKGGFQFYQPADWIRLQNALGAKLRGALARREQAA